MIFDSHAHLISPDRNRYPPAPLSGRLDERAFDNPVTPERLIAEMDAQGVGRALVVQRGQVYGFDNSYVCDAAEAYPERLAAVCSINGLSEDCGDQVHYSVGVRRAAGVRMMQPFWGADQSWFAGETARAVWVAAAKLDIPVCLLFGRNREAGLPALEQVLKAFPSVRVVLDHFTNMRCDAGPPNHGVDALMLRMAEFPQVTTKFTTLPLGQLDARKVDAAPVVRRVVDIFGEDRVMWGSDIGQSNGGYEYMVGLGRAATRLLTEAEREAVLYGTADRVYGRSFKAPRQPDAG